MNCPLVKINGYFRELNQVEIDYCTACKGIWLDNGELDLIFTNADQRNCKSFSVKNDFDEIKKMSQL
ncbi:MAG: zf-TFIIB domain-containing protein [Ignavibacteriales bacterium]|nr:zf-TFIIB domain-containing protein [Ignavibacteriales bacterium]